MCLQISAAKLQKWSAQLNFKQSQPYNMDSGKQQCVCVVMTDGDVSLWHVRVRLIVTDGWPCKPVEKATLGKLLREGVGHILFMAGCQARRLGAILITGGDR